MNRLPITALVATKNEEANLSRCLTALSPASRVIVVDSHSKDGTGGICARLGIDVVQFDYAGGYPKKRQWALDQIVIETEWILLIDADEVVPDELWQEIRSALRRSGGPDAYLIKKGFHFLGRRFRFGGFSHFAVLLFRRGKARFEQVLADRPDAPDMEIHERLLVQGRIGRFRTPLIHEDFKGLAAYIDRHNSYSTWEARVRDQFFRTGSWGEDPIPANLFGGVQERRRFLKKVAVRIPFEPQLWFLYHYIFRLGLLEGRPGLIASRIRAGHFAQARDKLFELRMRRQIEDRHPVAVNGARPENIHAEGVSAR